MNQSSNRHRLYLSLFIGVVGINAPMIAQELRYQILNSLGLKGFDLAEMTIQLLVTVIASGVIGAGVIPWLIHRRTNPGDHTPREGRQVSLLERLLLGLFLFFVLLLLVDPDLLEKLRPGSIYLYNLLKNSTWLPFFMITAYYILLPRLDSQGYSVGKSFRTGLIFASVILLFHFSIAVATGLLHFTSFVQSFERSLDSLAGISRLALLFLEADYPLSLTLYLLTQEIVQFVIFSCLVWFADFCLNRCSSETSARVPEEDKQIPTKRLRRLLAGTTVLVFFFLISLTLFAFGEVQYFFVLLPLALPAALIGGIIAPVFLSGSSYRAGRAFLGGSICASLVFLLTCTQLVTSNIFDFSTKTLLTYLTATGLLLLPLSLIGGVLTWALYRYLYHRTDRQSFWRENPAVAAERLATFD
ncbi:hypothetical protein [Kiloniella laminariae]|uniref:hypothetical protein n=1 Tax=Kiloniella laminariae TaxID=454162 RepID=UPI0003A7FDAE|nr:hypothetical protein [Kiloniella laminariae]